MATGDDGYTVGVAELRSAAAAWARRSDRLEVVAALASGAALGRYEFGFVASGGAVAPCYSSLAATLGGLLREAAAQADAVAAGVRLAADRYETADAAQARVFSAVEGRPPDASEAP